MTERRQRTTHQRGGLAGDHEAEQDGGFAEDEEPAHDVGGGPVEVLQPRADAGEHGGGGGGGRYGQRAQGAHDALTHVLRRHEGHVMKRV